MEIYLDNAATTKAYSQVAEKMTEILCENYGNPSSMHKKGLDAEMVIKDAQKVISSFLKVKEKEIIFTSGGTESDNMAIIGAALAYQRRGKHLITSQIEHPAVLEAFEYLKGLGFEVTFISVDEFGFLNINELRDTIREDTILVSVMHTNNEIGTMQPLEQIGKIIKEVNPQCIFHVDAVQGFGKHLIYPAKCNIDLMSASGHKIHGPKGTGILYKREQIRLVPILYGGGQQKAIRPGTENVPGIGGLAAAVTKIQEELPETSIKLRGLKEQMIKGLREFEGVRINGTTDGRDAYHILNVSFAGIRSEVLLHALEEKGIYVSSGSACASNKPSISKTLQGISISQEYLESAIRFSFSVFTNTEDIIYTLQVVQELVPVLRRFSRK